MMPSTWMPPDLVRAWRAMVGWDGGSGVGLGLGVGDGVCDGAGVGLCTSDGSGEETAADPSGAGPGGDGSGVPHAVATSDAVTIRTQDARRGTDDISPPPR
jgi:hypothetical protein